MDQTFRTSWVFLPIAAFCGLLYLHASDGDSLLIGLTYAEAFALRLPDRLSLRTLFPLLMLFLFLMVLNEAPTKLFTISLLYTTRALIVFRGLLIVLSEIQASETGIDKKQITWVSGLAIELMLSAILVYSTFRPVPIELLNLVRMAFLGTIMVLASVWTPYWVVGVILGALSFFPKTQIFGIMGFGFLALYESNFSPRSRNITPRVLP